MKVSWEFSLDCLKVFGNDVFGDLKNVSATCLKAKLFLIFNLIGFRYLKHLITTQSRLNSLSFAALKLGYFLIKCKSCWRDHYYKILWNLSWKSIKKSIINPKKGVNYQKNNEFLGTGFLNSTFPINFQDSSKNS
jgi:hypothetical protein